MTNILQDEVLTMEIREELLSELRKVNNDNIPLEDRIDGNLLDRCKLLRSAFNETLRLSSTGCTIRKVMTPITLEDKPIPESTIVFMPQRPLLLSKHVFGSDSSAMNPRRFFNAKLERSEYYRPFGTGHTLCAGRIIGRKVVMAFVALALLRYDIRPLKKGEKVLGVRGKPLPRVDDGSPSLGVATRIKGGDTILAISERKQ
jgi:cytochrome P450